MQKFYVSRFIANTDDALHCTQAALIMALDALRYPTVPTMADADTITGFRPGVETWPYTMLAWLGESGLEVIHEDALDPLSLAVDPEKELRRSGIDEETLAYFRSISDFDAESAAIRRAVASGRVKFDVGVPDISRLPARLAEGWIPMLSLDATVLAGDKHNEFDGHVVLVTSVVGSDVKLQDPGPPARPDWTVPLSQIDLAMRSPVDTSGTVTYVKYSSPAAKGGTSGTS